MNVLIMADYRTPNSRNFVASLLDLWLQLRNRNASVVYLFPKNNRG